MESTNQVYVNGIPHDCKEESLREAFGKFGEIVRVAVKTGFCFIEYAEDNSAREAIDAMNDRDFEGNKLLVKPASDRRRDRDRGGMSRGGRGGYDRDNRDSRGPQSSDVCKNCNKTGHWARSCPEERKPR